MNKKNGICPKCEYQICRCKKCCKKSMIDLGDIAQLQDMSIIDNRTYVCGECGKVIQENSYDYDDEELFNLMDNFSKKFEKTKIYKELKAKGLK